MEQAGVGLERSFGELTDGDLLGLRLAAQVLAHKAQISGRPRVAGYFADLGAAASHALARRGVGIVVIAPRPPSLEDLAEGDRRIVVEYLGLLIGNEGLSPAVRSACRALREGRTVNQP